MSDMMTALSTILSFLLGILFYGALIVVAGIAVATVLISIADGIACLLQIGPWKNRKREARYLKTKAHIDELETELGMKITERNTHVENHR